MTDSKQNWTAKHNDVYLNISAETDKEAWKIIGAKNENDRNLLKSNGFQVVRITDKVKTPEEL